MRKLLCPLVISTQAAFRPPRRRWAVPAAGLRHRLPRTASSRLPGGYYSNQTSLVSDTAALI
jgi:hypothetical protein